MWSSSLPTGAVAQHGIGLDKIGFVMGGYEAAEPVLPAGLQGRGAGGAKAVRLEGKPGRYGSLRVVFSDKY